ncbi:inhibitor of growth protein 3 isoform X4 [Phyllopteryx taeniolatus]|uniref:inhibitor of growth protein 3 isoform X4 n=1 Tax=Phyllopteryx taeniolatus TaxID=161469 RepID=UPI002AD3D6AB|nr:inhibitor of growth protein 3 isoform X4 [Phyllopteryx taeniolatus]
MLYLEDYLEMIEQLPMDLRDRFTEMREMDLQVQNATDQLEQKVMDFFVNAKKNKPEWREEHMEVIKKDYYKALEDADEKVQLANQIYDLVDRHLRKLDQELAKFKMELEADNAGITEILERRSLEMDSPSQPVNNHHVHSHAAAEKRKYSASTHHTTEHVPEKKFKSEALLSTLTSDACKENTPGTDVPTDTTTQKETPPPMRTITPTHTLRHMAHGHANAQGCRSNSTTSSSSSSAANNIYGVNSSQAVTSYSLSTLPAGPAAGAGAISMAAAQAVQATAQKRRKVFQPSVVFILVVIFAVVVLVGVGSGTFPAGVGAARGRGRRPSGLDLRPQRAALLHLQPGVVRGDGGLRQHGLSHRVVPLRLRGSERSPQREVVLSSVHRRHETTRKQTQVDDSPQWKHRTLFSF